MKAFVCATFLAIAAICLTVGSAQASVVIGGTRVIMNADPGEVTLPLKNVGKQPALVEAWVDKGNPKAAPDSVHTPFLITPPMARINPGKQQSLRIIFTPPKQALPTDRETLYWLNVQEIPPKPTGAAAGKNNMQFAVRSRLKVFYRPKGLPGSSFKAPEKLTFKTAKQDGKIALVVHNPTPYYVTIMQVALPVGSTPDIKASGMVAPFSDLSLPLQHATERPAAGTRLSFETINDYGAGQVTQAVVKP